MELLKGEEIGKLLERVGRLAPPDTVTYRWQTEAPVAAASASPARSTGGAGAPIGGTKTTGRAAGPGTKSPGAHGSGYSQD